MIAPAPGDETAIRVVEMEVAFELGGRRLARVAAVAALLLLGQEVDGHPRPFLKSSPSPRCRVPNRVPTPEASADTGNHRLPVSRDPVTKWVYPIWHTGTCGLHWGSVPLLLRGRVDVGVGDDERVRLAGWLSDDPLEPGRRRGRPRNPRPAGSPSCAGPTGIRSMRSSAARGMTPTRPST